VGYVSNDRNRIARSDLPEKRLEAAIGAEVVEAGAVLQLDDPKLV